MFDKLQFVAGLCGWFAPPDHDKLKFVGHFPHNNKVGLSTQPGFCFIHRTNKAN